MDETLNCAQGSGNVGSFDAGVLLKQSDSADTDTDGYCAHRSLAAQQALLFRGQ